MLQNLQHFCRMCLLWGYIHYQLIYMKPIQFDQLSPGHLICYRQQPYQVEEITKKYIQAVALSLTQMPRRIQQPYGLPIKPEYLASIGLEPAGSSRFTMYQKGDFAILKDQKQWFFGSQKIGRVGPLQYMHQVQRHFSVFTAQTLAPLSLSPKPTGDPQQLRQQERWDDLFQHFWLRYSQTHAVWIVVKRTQAYHVLKSMHADRFQFLYDQEQYSQHFTHPQLQALGLDHAQHALDYAALNHLFDADFPEDRSITITFGNPTKHCLQFLKK